MVPRTSKLTEECSRLIWARKSAEINKAFIQTVHLPSTGVHLVLLCNTKLKADIYNFKTPTCSLREQDIFLSRVSRKQRP